MKLIFEIKLSEELKAMLSKIIELLEKQNATSEKMSEQLDAVTGYDYNNNRVILTDAGGPKWLK